MDNMCRKTTSLLVRLCHSCPITRHDYRLSSPKEMASSFGIYNKLCIDQHKSSMDPKITNCCMGTFHHR